METMEKESVMVMIPAELKIMNDLDFLKIQRLIGTGLEIVSVKIDEKDETARLLWPILECACDLFNQHENTIDVLFKIGQARREVESK
jgi:hypothetical protein